MRVLPESRSSIDVKYAMPTPTIVRTRRTRITDTRALPRGCMRCFISVPLIPPESGCEASGSPSRGSGRIDRTRLRRDLAGADRQKRGSPRDGEPEADHVLDVESRGG